MFKKLIKQKYSIYTVRKTYNVEDRRGAYGVLFGKLKGKRSIGKRRRRWRIIS
jgi:hypothetical protein